MQIKNIYIESYGCSANQNNAELIAGLLARAGLNITNNFEIADLAIINTCIVKGPTQQRMQARIAQLSKKFGKKLVVAGCMPDVFSNVIKNIAPDASLVGSHNLKEIVRIVRNISSNKRCEFIEKRNEIKLCMPKLRQNNIIGITQILEGCLGCCSFCLTRAAKGKLFSYPRKKILQNIKLDLKAGCKEIWLTSQDCAAYGLDRKKHSGNLSELPELLKEILALNGRFKVRLGMCNPEHVLPIIKELIECFEHEKMYKFLHIPLQSGSNAVLREMKRKYTAQNFKKIIEKFRASFPEATISTDIIAGFPSETEEDFSKTIEIIRKTKPDILNISKFWPRPGTEAATLEQLPQQVLKKRAIELSILHKKITTEKNKSLIGKKLKVLVNRKGWHGTWLARDNNYKLIVLKYPSNLLGKILEVKVTQAFPHYLFGKIEKIIS